MIEMMFEAADTLFQFPRPNAIVLRLSKAPVTFAGGLRDDESGLHGFVMMRRQGPLVRKL